MAESTQGQGGGAHAVQSTQQRQEPSGQAAGTQHVAGQHDAHGQSVASWTAVGIIVFGVLVMAIAVVVTTVWLFVVGAVIVVLGAVAGKVLSAMGFGVSGKPSH
jgi:uncharacterized membrane protein